jgi:hypothetical protein
MFGTLIDWMPSRRHAILAAWRMPWLFFRHCMQRGGVIMELFSSWALCSLGFVLWLDDAGLPYFEDDLPQDSMLMAWLSILLCIIGVVHFLGLIFSQFRVRSICCLITIIIAASLTGVDHYGNLPAPLIRSVFPPWWACLALCFWSLEVERCNGRHS